MISRPATPLIGFGQVRHTRLRPVRHAFAYPTYFLMLPLRSMAAGQGQPTALALNRRAALSFHDADHGDGRGPEAGGALSWVDDLLRGHGITDATGEIWLHCYPRVLGYAFKPVSFWYCHRPDESLAAIVAEVNNTFGERHCYLLEAPRLGAELVADKVFHVSPFCALEGRYRFRFMRRSHGGQEQTVVRVEHDDASGPLIVTSVSGNLLPADAANLRRAFWRYPAMSFGVVARIHWQALSLWRKSLPFVSKPAPPASFVTR